MSGIITTKDFEVHSYEVDYYHNLLPEMILSYLQDTAMDQSEKIGAGVEFLNKENLNWILIRYHVNILKYPKYQETITVSTNASGFHKMFAYRDFRLLDKNGEELITASTQWLLLDGTSHKMLKIDDRFYEAYGISKDDKPTNDFEKLLSPMTEKITRKFRAGRSDIDFNGHVNNTRYIAWALDTMALEILKNYTLKEFDIVFKKEVLFNDDITVVTDTLDLGDGLKGLHEIKNDQNEVSCTINTIWEKR